MIAKKSQITLVMLIGLALFILVGFVFYLTKVSVQKPTSRNIREVQTAVLETQPLTDFINQCIEKVSKDSIILLASQGGAIYKSQGGTIVDTGQSRVGKSYVQVLGKNKVKYNIKKSFSVLAPYSSDIPEYPWRIFPFKDDLSSVSYNGFFGTSKLLPLEKSSGPNSFQSQIESYIDFNLGSCLDFKAFENQGFEIESLDSSTEAIIGSTDVTIKTNMPISVKNSVTGEGLDIGKFSSNLDIRFRELYIFVNKLINKDIEDIQFDIMDPDNNKDGFFITVQNDIFNNDDLIIITDDKSNVLGEPIQYRFVRENRNPALYYIQNDVVNLARGAKVDEAVLLGSWTKTAYDPDEDLLSYEVTALLPDPSLPTILNKPYINFKVEVSDGALTDEQNIRVNQAFT
jgi:hypothetical protein